MAKPLMRTNRAKALSTALFLVGMGVLFFFHSIWPAILLVIAIPLALRQFLLGRTQDAFVSISIFALFFFVANFNVSWKILAPILFVMAGIYILCKEWVKEEEERLEIDEKEDDKNLF